MIKGNNYIYRWTQLMVILLGMSAGSAVGSSYINPQAWVNVYGSKTDIKNIDDINGVGVVMGLDAEFGSDLIMGAAFSIGESEVDDTNVVAGTKTDIETNTYQAIIYGLKTLDSNLMLRTTGTLGWSDNDSDRSVGGGKASADFNAWFANLHTQLGRSYTVGDEVVLTPSFDANYNYLSTESYEESGSPLVAVKMGERDDESLILGAKLKTQYDLLTARLGIGYEVLSNRSSVQSTVISSGTQFTTNGAGLNEGFVFNGGVGIRVFDSETTSGHLDYDFINGDDADTQMISASMTYKF